MRTYTGSTNCDDRGKSGNSKGKIMVNLKENCRDPEEIAKLNQQYVQNGKPPKYDINKASMNIYYETCLTEEEAFNYVFGESMERYNAGQKRADRKTNIEKELAKLSKGKVQQELIHCMVVQVGNHEEHPPIDECVEILREYRERFIRQFPNMRIVSSSIHLDELDDGTPHLQTYFIPVKTREQHEAMGNPKKWSGMDVQPSLTGALEQMGYSNDAKITLEDGRQVHDYKNGAMAQWQRDFNGLLDEICMEHDIAIDHYMRGKKVTHQDTRDYYEGKINKDVARALHDKEKVDADLTNALLDVENTEEKLQKTQKDLEKNTEDNNALKEQNEALRTDNAALMQERDNAIKERDAAIKERDDARKEAKDLEATVDGIINEAEKGSIEYADEYIAYYKRARVQIEQDPIVAKAFENARKVSQQVKDAWANCRSSYTSLGRQMWAKKAIKLQNHANEVWQEAKSIAETARFEAQMKRLKAEVKKEIEELYKPHVDDFEKFCEAYERLSEQKQVKYKEQFNSVKKKNKKDIRTMNKHLNTFLGLKNKAMDYDLIKEMQNDHRTMNKLTNKMLDDIKAEASSGDAIDLFDLLEQNKDDKDFASSKGADAVKDDLEALLEDDGPEL